MRTWGARGLLHCWDDAATDAVVAGLGDEHYRPAEMCLKVSAAARRRRRRPGRRRAGPPRAPAGAGRSGPGAGAWSATPSTPAVVAPARRRRRVGPGRARPGPWRVVAEAARRLGIQHGHDPAMQQQRTDLIVATLDDAFAPLMRADPPAFRAKYRTMAKDPHAFFRGTACLFDADVTALDDPYVDDRCAPDLDPRRPARGELRHLSQLRRPAGLRRQRLRRGLSRPLHVGPDAVRGQPRADRLAEGAARGRRPPADRLATSGPTCGRSTTTCAPTTTTDFALDLETATGPVLEALRDARLIRRADLLDGLTLVDDGVRVFQSDADASAGSVRRSGRRCDQAFEGYLETIPDDKRFDRDLFYDVRDVVGKSGFGIGSAGLPAYNVLVEGYSQALDNDVVLSMKQANVPALSRFVDSGEIDAYFDHEGQRTVVSQRALQAHTDPLLGYTTVDGVGLRRRRGLAVRGRPGVGRHHRARGDRRGGRPARAGPPPRSTAPPTRTAARTSWTSRWRRRSPSCLERPTPGAHRALSSTSGSPTPRRCARTTTLFVEAFRQARIGISAT